MKLAYLILAHKNPNQLRRLMRAVYDPSHYYLIHVNIRGDEECHQVVREMAARHRNVKAMRSRGCTWGGYSFLDLELSAIRQLLDAEADWDFFINLSGQDFPLRTQPEIASYLAEHKGRNFMWIHDPLESGFWPDAAERLRYIYLEVPYYEKLVKLPKLRISRGFVPGGDAWYGGSAWLVLSREFCRYAVYSDRARRLRRFFRHTLLPDESFFQTAIMGSEYERTLVNDYKRQISWPYSASPHPKVYTADDLDELTRSDAFFARKFDESVDSVVIEKLEARLGLA